MCRRNKASASHSDGSPPLPKRPRYEQQNDPTLSPFMRSGRTLIGQKALGNQRQRQQSKTDDVRESALPSPATRRNEGLHEVVPTDMRNTFFDFPALQELQSGARTSPSLTVFRHPDGGVGGHTQTFPKPSSNRGSTHTRGQSRAHDRLREAAKKAKKSKARPKDTMQAVVSEQIRATASGKEILADPYLNKAEPNLSSVGGAIEPPGSQAPVRARFASEAHSAREGIKERWFAFEQQEREPNPSFSFAPPSPLRAPMDSGPGSGEYLAAPFPLNRIPEVPQEDHIAHRSAWMTQPGRTLTTRGGSSSTTSSSTSTATVSPPPRKKQKIQRKKRR